MDPKRNGGSKQAVSHLLAVIDLDDQLSEAKARLKKQDLRQYDLLRSRVSAPSQTVVQLVQIQGGGLCVVCNRVVPTAHFFKAETGDLIRCETCGRFLVKGPDSKV